MLTAVYAVLQQAASSICRRAARPFWALTVAFLGLSWFGVFQGALRAPPLQPWLERPYADLAVAAIVALCTLVKWAFLDVAVSRSWPWPLRLLHAAGYLSLAWASAVIAARFYLDILSPQDSSERAKQLAFAIAVIVELMILLLRMMRAPNLSGAAFRRERILASRFGRTAPETVKRNRRDASLAEIRRSAEAAEFGTVGDAFDPALHKCAEVRVSFELRGTILEVLQPGLRVPARPDRREPERLIKRAIVAVSSGPYLAYETLQGAKNIELLGPRSVLATQLPDAPAPQRRRKVEKDDLDIRVFSRASVAPRSKFLVQVWFYPSRARRRVIASARQADRRAEARGGVRLPLAPAFGSAIRVTLQSPGCAVADPDQTVPWHGEPVAAYFTVAAPDDTADITLTVRIFIDIAPIAVAHAFVVRVALEPPEPPFLLGTPPHRNHSVFMCYTREDRETVLGATQVLRAAGMDVYQDILQRPGVDWEPLIEENIRAADVFLIFWSKAAATSAWVRREAEYALACQVRSPRARPQIVPVILDGPPPPEPPESLKRIHFDDPIRCVVVAQRGAMN